MNIFNENINPNEEDAQSQNKRLTAYLEAGNTITSLESWLLIECGRLASRVNDLHNEGVPVKSVTVIRKEVKDETGKVKKKLKRFSAYYLDEGIKKKYSVNDEDIPELVKSVTERRINSK